MPPKNWNSPPKIIKPLTILLADDVLDLQALMAAWLKEAGHDVTCASNGRDVIKLAHAQPFDVVVTDILMPDGDGWDAIAEVHRVRPEAAIVAISGGAREIPANAALRVAHKAGAIGMLEKPFSRIDLLEAIAQVTSRRR
jgi:CheY-like chemotaxis protein